MQSDVRETWRALRPEIEDLFARQWNDPELPGLETASSARLADWLERHGFAVTRGFGGVPTAFVASSGAGGGPTVGILAEFDALPGLANAAEARRRPATGVAGHGCGHNHIGPANCGAAIAAALTARAQGRPGRITVVGCPAEEILWGKVALLRRGAFDGCDVLLTSHGDYQSGAISRPCQAVVSGEFVFSGAAGHGGLAGRPNALQAMETAIGRIEAARQQHFPETMLRHVIRRGGTMPGITPDEARVWYTARGFDMLRQRDAYETVRGICERAGAEAGIAVSHLFIVESRGYLPNDVLGRALQSALAEVGPPAWTGADLAFMAGLAEACSGRPGLTLDRSLALYDNGLDHYGQDDGEASWRIPLGRVNWA